MKGIHVVVLCDGHIVRDGAEVIEAHSSVTMVSWPEHVMIVDTSDVSYQRRLVEALSSNEVDPDQVDIVVNTHMHRDHCGNNDLFRYAKFIAHRLECPPSSFSRAEGVEELHSGVTLVHTPGHTEGSMSVFIEGDRKYAIVGDAMPTVDNYRKWAPPGISWDRMLALRSMDRIVSFAEVIVPGHGPAFEVLRSDRFIRKSA